MNYESALQRAYDVLPDQPREAGERLSIPDPEARPTGRSHA